MAITVNGVEFSVHAGKRHNYIVQCPQCGRQQIYSTNKDDLRHSAKSCVNCGFRFSVKSRIVKDGDTG